MLTFASMLLTSLHSTRPVAIKLTLDVPSIRTGTGSSVYLAGADVALVRATVVDAAGNVVHNSTANITFAVVDGTYSEPHPPCAQRSILNVLKDIAE